MHLAERDHVMYQLRADNDALIVKHHRKPGVRDFLDDLSDTNEAPEDIEIARVSTATDFLNDLTARAPAAEASDDAEESGILPHTSSTEGPPAVPHERGNSPTVASSHDQTQDASDHKIDHIVFLMMENRSFDHMLGYRGLANQEVNGLSGNEFNRLTADIPPYPVFHYTKTYGIPSPDHGMDATLEQIAQGAMSGFVQNYAKNDPGNDLRLVMSYYTGQELPMYEFLANNFAICDSWHSSHPGETQCNRFCASTGRTPELDNLDITDPRIAYYRARTVFDVLTESDVDWAYVEGNIGFIRMFDRYRLDTQRVIPYRDDSGLTSDTFIARVEQGHLPSVTFIDPNFIDIPPAWAANDDLPPADVCRGQELVRGLYDVLSKAPTWDRTLLVITYDEHGGFFDHSVPAGMPGSAHETPLPRVHPDGADHLGLRVPTFIVSPWIDAGTVIKTLFDHTSIIKTIVERFAPAQFPIADVFGERAASANGLLTELNRPTVRQDKPPIPGFECHSRTSPPGPAVQLDRTDFVTSMRLLGLPPLYRGRAVI
ncbi:alkaline phosphatase family protein [Arthrobacter sp. ok362]|uniref:alkaline phosphatase family protein n=1 Tax=Arthrobacter sp. ok362 TaxID=1761745 RepID=UPI0008917052|nr:alkaline phosphatase family protein [Arthrobacter sp. ok362]SDL40447.1 phospholipase C [Arthrobacter sp. ok362]